MGVGYQPNKDNNNTYARKSQHNTDSNAVLVGDTHTHQTLAPAVTPPAGPAGPKGAPFS